MTRARYRTPTKMRFRGFWARPCRCDSPRSLRKASLPASSEAEVSLLALFRRTPSSASVAKERLRIIVAQERSARGSPDYLPLLRREILQVIHKYVNVDPEAVQINLGREEGHEVLELSVALPEKTRA